MLFIGEHRKLTDARRVDNASILEALSDRIGWPRLLRCFLSGVLLREVEFELMGKPGEVFC
jgi:hypothetical protein